jgi:hypothetical protein
MKNEIKRGLLAGIAGVGVLAFALASSTARAADPAPSGSMGETDQALPRKSKTELVHMTATVEKIDKSGHKLTLKGPEGERKEIKVPSDVKGFDKLKVGDKIDVDFMESLAVSMLPAGAKPSVTERAATAPGAAGRELSIAAEIVSVDADAHKVTLKGPRGKQMTVSVQDPELQARLPNLKPGQVVQLQYTEAVATAIQPPSK